MVPHEVNNEPRWSSGKKFKQKIILQRSSAMTEKRDSHEKFVERSDVYLI